VKLDLQRLAETVRARCPEARVKVLDADAPRIARVEALDHEWALQATVYGDGHTHLRDGRLTPARIAVLTAVLEAVREQIAAEARTEGA
jgi:hypothetical protein